MPSEPATYPGYRFPAEVISHAVWLYHVFGLSLRDVELILAKRGIGVTHESVRQWCLRFGADFARKLRRRRPKPGDTWHMDEVLILPAKSAARLPGVATLKAWTGCPVNTPPANLAYELAPDAHRRDPDRDGTRCQGRIL